MAEHAASRRTVHAMGTLVLLSLIGAVTMLGVHPLVQQHRVEREATLEAAMLRDEISTLRAQNAAIERTRVTLLDRIGESQLQLHGLDALNERLAGITEVLERSGLVVDGLSPQPALSAARFASVRIRVSGQGDYPSVTRAIADVHRGFSDVHIEALAMRAGDARTGAAGAFEFVCVWIADPAGSADRDEQEN